MRSTNTRLPLWLRVVLYAHENHDAGRARLYAGELRQALGVDRPAEVSRAIRVAARYGALSDDSSARCLILKRRDSE